MAANEPSPGIRASGGAAAVTGWFRKSLGDGITAEAAITEIQHVFEPLFEAAGAPDTWAVFTLPVSEGRVQCEVFAYITPAAAAVARCLGATPCVAPAATGMTLVAGPAAAWRAVFPGPCG